MAPCCLEKILAKILSYGDLGHLTFALDLIQALLYNNIKLDFNWRCTDEGGDTVMCQICRRFETLRWGRSTEYFLTVISEHGADLNVSNNSGTTPIELLIRNKKVGRQSLCRILELEEISSAINHSPGLPEKLLQAATRWPAKVEYIFHQLAKDEDIHGKLLQKFSAHHCTANYMKVLFNLWLRKKARQDVSSKDEDSWGEESSDEGPSVLEECEASIATIEGEFKDDDSSVVKIDKGNAFSRELDPENASSIITVEENGVSPLTELTERVSPMAETEVAALDKILEESNQSPNMDERKDADLHLLSGSLESTDFGKLRLFLARNPNPEIRNSENLTALAISINTKNLRAMYALLIAGADIESHTSHGQTYLHLACSVGNEEAVAALLDAGVNTLRKDDSGNTAKDYAARNGRPDIVDLFLRDACAKSPSSISSDEELPDCPLLLGENSGDLTLRPK